MYRLTFHSPLSLCLTLILISLIPALNIIHLPRFYSPHYAFFTVIPFSMLLLLLIETTPWKYRYLPLTLWIILAGWQTVQGGYKFQDDYTLFAPEVQAAPLYKEGNLYLGNYYAREKQYSKSEKAYKASLLPLPRTIAYDQRSATLLNLTTVLLKGKKYTEAEKYLSRLEEASPQSLDGIRLRKAYLYSATRKPMQVIQLLVPHLGSLSLEELTFLANAYHNTKQNTKATETLKRMLPLLPPDKRSQMEAFIKSQT